MIDGAPGAGRHSSVAQWQSIRLLTGGLQVRVLPEEPFISQTHEYSRAASARTNTRRMGRVAGVFLVGDGDHSPLCRRFRETDSDSLREGSRPHSDNRTRGRFGAARSWVHAEEANGEYWRCGRRASAIHPHRDGCLGSPGPPCIAKEVTGKRRARVFGYSRYLKILSEGTEPIRQ